MASPEGSGRRLEVRGRLVTAGEIGRQHRQTSRIPDLLGLWYALGSSSPQAAAVCDYSTPSFHLPSSRALSYSRYRDPSSRRRDGSHSYIFPASPHSETIYASLSSFARLIYLKVVEVCFLLQLTFSPQAILYSLSLTISYSI